MEEVLAVYERSFKHHDVMIVPDVTTDVIWIENLLESLNRLDQSVYRSGKGQT